MRVNDLDNFKVNPFPRNASISRASGLSVRASELYSMLAGTG